jgi:hypothetical protein
MKEPTISGDRGRAWKVDLSAQVEHVDQTACLQSWIIEQPGVHVFWSRWQVSVVHLRDIPGQSKQAFKKFPEATHEFMIFALDPECYGEHEAWPAKIERVGLMHPADLVHQVAVTSDQVASHLCELLVEGACRGQVILDSDYCSRNRAILDATVERYNSGKHGIA